jgi:hypothetical protein
MPRAEIASKQAVYTLGLLHAELAGKLLANKREAIRLRMAMMQVEAVVKMLQPGFNVASIAAKRRNKSNPWFKRGTLFRSAVDVLRRAAVPMTAREIADALIAGKAPQATRKQAIDLQAAILAALRCGIYNPTPHPAIGEPAVSQTFSPLQMRAADIEIISLRRLLPSEVARLTQSEFPQVHHIARREFRIDEIALLYRSVLASRRAAEFPESI